MKNNKITIFIPIITEHISVNDGEKTPSKFLIDIIKKIIVQKIKCNNKGTLRLYFSRSEKIMLNTITADKGLSPTEKWLSFSWKNLQIAIKKQRVQQVINKEAKILYNFGLIINNNTKIR